MANPLPAQPQSAPQNQPAAGASAPPPAPSSPSVQLNVPVQSQNDESVDAEMAKELEALSPFSVLEKKRAASGGGASGPQPSQAPQAVRPVPPPAPTPPPPRPTPTSAQPSREELIRQANSAPADPFILPTASQASGKPAESVSASPVMPPPPKPVQPPIARPVPPPAPTPPPPRPVPPANPPVPQQPVVPSRPVEAVRPQAQPASIPAPQPLPGSSTRKSRPIGLIAGLGAVVALALIGGGGYILASSGARVPVLYTMVSGLKNGGLAVGQDALASVNAKQSYQMNGDVLVQLKDSAGGALPDSDISGTAPITSLSSKSTAAVPLLYDIKNDQLLGRQGLTIDAYSELPVYLRTAGATDTDDAWVFELPANTVNTLVRVPGSDIEKTLLYPALRPLPLTTLLSALAKEQGYQKVSGKQAAQYVYTLAPEKITGFLPEGAILSEAKADITYNWQTSQPTVAIFDGTFTYNDATYRLYQKFEYTDWDAGLPLEADASLSAIASASIDEAEEVGIQGFVQQLGTSLQAIPHSFGDDLPDVPAITPQGTTILSPGQVIQGAPPLPVSPATELARQRDTTRLSNLSDLQKALEEYKTKQGSYPVSNGLEQTQASSTLINALTPTYLTGIPVDPMEGVYWYEYKSDGSAYFLRAVAEDSANPQAKPGKAYYYFELTNSSSEQ